MWHNSDKTRSVWLYSSRNFIYVEIHFYFMQFWLWAQWSFIRSRSLVEPHFSLTLSLSLFFLFWLPCGIWFIYLSSQENFYWQHLLRASYVLSAVVGPLHELSHVLELMGLWSRYNVPIFLGSDLWLKDVKSHASRYISVKMGSMTGPYSTVPHRLLPACSPLSWKLGGTFLQNWRKLAFDEAHTKGK